MLPFILSTCPWDIILFIFSGEETELKTSFYPVNDRAGSHPIPKLIIARNTFLFVNDKYMYYISAYI